MNLTKEEKSAIRALRKVAGKWPKSLWLFAADGILYVMRKNEQGERVVTNNEPYPDDIPGWLDGFDSNYVVNTIDGFDIEGGAW